MKKSYQDFFPILQYRWQSHLIDSKDDLLNSLMFLNRIFSYFYFLIFPMPKSVFEDLQFRFEEFHRVFENRLLAPKNIKIDNRIITRGYEL